MVISWYVFGLKRVGGGLGTYTKVHGNREVFAPGGFGNGFAAVDAREMDERGSHNVLLASVSFEDLLGESAVVSLQTFSRKKKMRTGTQHRPWTEWRSRHRPWL